MKKRNLFVVCVAIALALTMVLAVACGKQQNTSSRNYAASESTAKPIAAPEAEQKDAQVRATEAGHTHSYTVWNHDETEHWKSCSCGAVDMRTYLPHTFDGDTCECGATPHTTHQWTVWRYDAENHWKVCYICGLQQTEEEKALHEYNNGLCECGKLEKGEFKDTPIEDGGAPYVVIGSGAALGNWATEMPTNRFLTSGPDDPSPNYYIEISFKAGDQFKVKYWAKPWSEGEFGYYTSHGVEFAAGLSYSETDMFTSGHDDDGAANSNFYVLRDCTVYLTIYQDNPNYIKIYVESVGSGSVDNPNPTTGDYVFVHDPNCWDDNTGTKLTLDPQTNTYKLSGVTLQVGEAWKIKKAGVDWNTWQFRASNTVNVVYASSVTQRPTDKVFGGTDNIETNYTCTFDLELIPSSMTVNITVTAITIPEHDITYSYNFHVYAPASVASGLQIHVWKDGGGDLTNWNTTVLTPEAGHNGWYIFTYTSKIPVTTTLGIIIHKGDTKYAVFNDENDSSSGPAVTLKENIYLVYNQKVEYNSREAAQAAAGFTISTVTPVQVATIPPQTIRKQRLAA